MSRYPLRLVLLIDRLLQWAQGVRAYDPAPDCILRCAREDGVVVLHLWNERLPALHAAGPPREWPRRLVDGCRHSLRLLARQVRGDPRVRGCRGRMFFARPQLYVPGYEAMGFTITPMPEATGLRRLLPLYTALLTRALFGRGPRPQSLRRYELWMPRERLLALGEDAE